MEIRMANKNKESLFKRLNNAEELGASKRLFIIKLNALCGYLPEQTPFDGAISEE